MSVRILLGSVVGPVLGSALGSVLGPVLGPVLGLSLLVSACDQEVRLGALAIDGESDAGVQEIDASPFPANNATLSLGTLSTQCDGNLTGQEVVFDGWSADDAGFSPGALQLTWVSSTSLSISGTPIEYGFQVQSIGLLPHVIPEQPEELLIGIVSLTGSAPDGMSKDAAMFVVDMSSMTSESLAAQVGLLFSDPSSQGSCSLSIDAVLSLTP